MRGEESSFEDLDLVVSTRGVGCGAKCLCKRGTIEIATRVSLLRESWVTTQRWDLSSRKIFSNFTRSCRQSPQRD